MTKPTKQFSLIAVIIALTIGTASCEDEDNEELLGNWVETGIDFPGTARGGAVCFKIGNKAYVGTGANTTRTEDKERYRDFYCFDGDTYAWSARWERTMQGVTSMPEAAAARNGGVGFTLNGKGYVGLGYDGTNYLRDFWEFDPEGTPDASDYPSIADTLLEEITATGCWTQVASYPGDSCRYSVAFVIGEYAYVGSGEDYDDNKLSDFYRFDGTSWEAIPSLGRPRAQASAFVCEVDGQEYGYVVGGNNSGAVDWFQRYNPETNAWEDLRRTSDRSKEEYDDDYTLAAYGCTAFVLGDRAYITTGGSSGIGTATWEYHPDLDYWVQKTSFEGSQRKFAVSFVLDIDGTDVPFVTTGGSSDLTITGNGGTFYTDMWYFNPYEEYEYRD